MQDKLFSIGEVAKLFHISISSLRHYEEIGLLQPEYIDANSNYRYYSTNQFEILNSIRYLRELDFPLKEIRDFLNNKDVSTIEKKLEEQSKEVSNRIDRLKKIQSKINNRLETLSDASSSQLDEIRIVEKGQSKIIWLEKEVTISSYLDMEPLIRQLESNQDEALVFLGKVGLALSIPHLKERNLDKYDGVFLALDKEDNYRGEAFSLPKSSCVSIRFCGSHNKSPLYYQRLLDYIDANHLTIASFARETTLIDYGITNDESKFVTEILIPIEN